MSEPKIRKTVTLLTLTMIDTPNGTDFEWEFGEFLDWLLTGAQITQLQNILGSVTTFVMQRLDECMASDEP